MMSVVAATLVTPVDPLAMTSERCDSVQNILFFDGVCGLCSHAVDFVMARDHREKIKFAPIQGDTARRLLSDADRQNLDTMVFWMNGVTFRKSSAAVRILWQLGFFWRILGTLLWIVPKPLRDLAYTLVASNRYRFFGKKESCRLPTPAERLRFLP